MIFTHCPGCEHLVRVWPGNQVNFCCRPCWLSTWDRSYLADLEDRDPVNHGHSDSCWQRQDARRNEPVQVGEYTLMVPDAFATQVQSLQ